MSPKKKKQWTLHRIDHSCFSRPTLPHLRHIISEDPRIRKYYPYEEAVHILDNLGNVSNSGSEEGNKWNHLRAEESLFYEEINKSAGQSEETYDIESPDIESPEIDDLFDDIMNSISQDETEKMAKPLDSPDSDKGTTLESSRQKLKMFLNKAPENNVVENPFLSNTAPIKNVSENTFRSNITPKSVAENPFLSIIAPANTVVENPFLSINAPPKNPVENPFLSNPVVENPFTSKTSILDSKIDENNREKLEKLRNNHGRVKSLLANIELPPILSNKNFSSDFKEVLRTEHSTKKSGDNIFTKTSEPSSLVGASSCVTKTSYERELHALKRILKAAKASTRLSRSRSRSIERKKSPIFEINDKSRSQSPIKRFKSSLSRSRSPLSNSSTSRDRLSRPRAFEKKKKKSRSPIFERKYKSRSKSRFRSSRSRSKSPLLRRSTSKDRLSRPRVYRKQKTIISRSRSRSPERKKLNERSRSKSPYSQLKNRWTSFRDEFKGKSSRGRHRSKSPSTSKNKRRKLRSRSPDKNHSHNKYSLPLNPCRSRSKSPVQNKLQVPSVVIDIKNSNENQLLLPSTSKSPVQNKLQIPPGVSNSHYENQILLPSTNYNQEMEHSRTFKSDREYILGNTWNSSQRKKVIKKTLHQDIHCDVCNVFVNTEIQYNLHVNSKKHQKKAALKNAVLNAGGKLPENFCPPPAPAIILSCDVCQKYKFQTVDAYNSHMMSIKHMKNFTATLNQVSEIQLSNSDKQANHTAIESFQKYSQKVFANEEIEVEVKKKGQVIEKHCEICDIKVNSEEQFEMHLISRGHRKKLANVNKLPKKK